MSMKHPLGLRLTAIAAIVAASLLIADAQVTVIPSFSSIGSSLLFYPDNTVDIGAVGANRPRTIYVATTIVAGSTITGGAYRIGATLLTQAPADGNMSIANTANVIGSHFKVDALPVASACGAGSPAVVAGSTALSGSVTVGTGGPITCTITYGGTAYPSAPHCSGSVETTTAANARAMGYSSSATVLTIVPAAAWADSSVVNWTCISAK